MEITKEITGKDGKQKAVKVQAPAIGEIINRMEERGMFTEMIRRPRPDYDIMASLELVEAIGRRRNPRFEIDEENRFAYAFLGRGVPGAMGGMSASDFLWTIQYRVIQDLAEKEPCVIVGRCADYILRDRKDCLHTFIHAPIPFRADRIVRLYGESEKAPEKRLADKDTRRRVNYKHYTDREWGMAQNYHVTLDSGVLGIDRCVDIILELAQADYPEE